MEQQSIVNYLKPDGLDAFWCWSDNVDSVTWASGSAIAFHQEIDKVLDHLKANGLPRFEELVLVLAACRQNWNERESRGGKALFLEYLQSLDTDPMANPGVVADWVRPLLAGLDSVHRLFMLDPSLDTKLALCERIFEKFGDHLKADDAHAVARMVEQGLSKDEVIVELPDHIKIDDEGLHWVCAPVEGEYHNWDLDSLDGPLTQVGKNFEKGAIVAIHNSKEETHFSYDIRAEFSGRVVEVINEKIAELTAGDPIFAYIPDRTASKGFVQTVRNLLQALQPLEKVESIDLRRKTGLDDVPEPTPDDELLPDRLAVRQLIGSLIDADDKELSGLALVARDLMGAIHVPRDVADPDDRPRGGYSDIANRGNIDRLLLTELAQDDDILMTRIALNEALYLRRETPPRQSPRKRSLFIDTSIRMWGVPRVFAHSVALALAATVDNRDQVEVWSGDAGDPDKLLPVDLRSRDGLVEQLGRLSGSEHPGETVLDFLNSFSGKNIAQDSGNEPFLITHPNVFGDPNFRKSLAKLKEKGQAFFVITVTGEGHCVLFSHTMAGIKELRSLQIDPSVLAGSPGNQARDRRKTSSALVRDEVNTHLPLILRLRYFPLLMSHHADQKKCVFHPDFGLVTRAKKHQLLYFSDPGYGAVILDDVTVGGACLLRTIDGNSSCFAEVTVVKGEVTVVIADLVSHECDVVKIQVGKKPRFAFVRDFTLVLIFDREVISYDLVEGAEIERITLSGHPHSLSDRFIRCSDGWFAITMKPLSLTEVPLPDGIYTAIVEHPDYEAPIAIHRDGMIHYLGEDARLVFGEKRGQGLADSFIGVSEDNSVLNFRSSPQAHTQKKSFFQVDLLEKEAKTSPHSFNMYSYDSRALPFVRTHHTVRKNFQSVFLWKNSIGLRTSSVSMLALEANPVKPGLHLARLNDAKAQGFEGLEVKFVSNPIRQPGYHIRLAKFADGSQAYLDARGMLHFKSADFTVPEITFVLMDGPLSGWISTGEFFGEPYFIGDNQSISSAEVIRYLGRFCAGIEGRKP